MKYIKEYWKYIIFILGFMILATTYVYTKMDLSWVFSVGKVNVLTNGFLPLTDALTAILANVNYLKILTYGIVSLSMFIIIRNIINQKNNSLVYIGIFLFFLINSSILNESYVSIVGFVESFMGLVFTLTIINYLINDNLYKIPKHLIVLSGVISVSFNVIYALIILLVLLYKIIINFKNKEKNKSIYLLFIGVLLGNIFIFSLNNISLYIGIQEISQNVLYHVFPNIININFIFTIILLAFLFRFAIKRYLFSSGYEKTNIILSLGGIIIYAFVCLLSKSTYLNYISLIFYIVSSYYIIIHGSASPSFKEKINMYYFIKVIYLILISIIKVSINVAFFPAIIDIIIILELVNITFKKNYLIIPYTFIAILMIFFEIIMSNNTKVLVKDMKNYLRRDLSCDVIDITLPSRFKEEELNIYLPYSKEEKEIYLKYLDIDKKFDYKIEFTK